jgi:hypothetical protein
VFTIGIAVALTQLTVGLSPIEIHGEAEWIMRDRAIQWCCGPRECSVVPKGGVVADGTGWRVPETGQRFRVGDQYTYWSKDQQMWWCRVKGSNGQPMHGVVQCLFVPKPGA